MLTLFFSFYLGDILDLKVFKTWEFTTEKPIRNIVFPYLVTGPPSFLVTILGIESLKETVSLPYFLLVLPRIIMCCISLLNDLLLYDLCRIMKKDHNTLLTMFSSSYVTLVHLTRTFSNCFEVLFFSLAIYLVCKLLLHMKSGPDVRRIRYIMNLSFMFGLVIAMGVFNRPTFVCFASIPAAVFAFTLLEMKYNIKTKLNFIFSFILGGISISLSFTLIDTFYYNKIHFNNLQQLCHNLIITPLNFISYNTNKSNLDSHGLHPRWLHIFVNVPLLFSVYGIFVMLDFLRVSLKLLREPSMNFKVFLILSFIAPLLLLSIIPHQEPRFLLPLIFPLCLLYNDSFFYRFISKSVCVKLWYVTNILGIIFYGFLHQGGVYLSSNFIHSSVKNNTNCAVIFYKTYMPPRYLLGLGQNQNVGIYDFAGADLDHFELAIDNVILQHKPLTVYVVTTDEIADSVLELHFFQYRFNLLMRKALFPHLSTEHLPKFNKIKERMLSNMSVVVKLHEIKKMFSIHVLFFKIS